MSAVSRAIPTPALILGLGGLIPFISAALLTWISVPVQDWLPNWILRDRGIQELASIALIAYGAVILSFLGGIRWGNLLFDHANLRQWTPLTLSVLPSLLAWLALLLAPIPALILLALAFCLQLCLDISATSRGELPRWFLTLRLILSTGAVLSTLLGLFGLVLR